MDSGKEVVEEDRAGEYRMGNETSDLYIKRIGD